MQLAECAQASMGIGLLKFEHRMLVHDEVHDVSARCTLVCLLLCCFPNFLKENWQHLQYLLQRDEQHQLAVNKVKQCLSVCVCVVAGLEVVQAPRPGLGLLKCKHRILV